MKHYYGVFITNRPKRYFKTSSQADDYARDYLKGLMEPGQVIGWTALDNRSIEHRLYTVGQKPTGIAVRVNEYR